MLNFSATRFNHRMYPVGMQLQKELSDVSGVVEESVTGVRVVKGFGVERMQRAPARDRGRQRLRPLDGPGPAARRTSCRSSTCCPRSGSSASSGTAATRCSHGNLSVGDIVSANLFVVMLIWPLRMIGMLVGQLPRSAAAGRSHRLDPRDRSRDRGRAERAPAARRPGRGALRAASRSATGAVRPCSTVSTSTIEGGEAVALVGATASGKTTIARLIPRFYDVHAGHVRIDGADVRDVRLREVRRVGRSRVRGHVPVLRQRAQQHRVRRSRSAERSGRARAAQLAGADEFIRELPEGYDTIIGEHGYSLSGGQRQRIAIARAVLADPRILILDDATSSVDPSKEHEIRAALAEVMQGRTTIIIAHRPATIALADRVVLLDEGKVVADGTHERLLATSPRYREVLARAATRRAEAGVVDDEELLDLAGGGRLMGWWGDNVPEETLSRDEATRVVRRLLRMLRPQRGADHRRGRSS